MAVTIKAGKSRMSELEKEVRIAMIRAEVTQVDLADYENVAQSAINMRLKRLNTQKANDMIALVEEVAAWKRKQTPKKAAG